MTDEGIRFECSGCHRQLAAPADAVGREVTCPECGTTLTVPLVAAEGGRQVEVQDPDASGSRPAPDAEAGAATGLSAAAPSVTCRYAAFVSYRHVDPDRQWAEWLSEALETYRVPRRLVRKHGLVPRIGKVFRDEEELPASADLNSEIARALEESFFLIVVCSPRTPRSEWVNGEVARFREMGRHARILALLIEGEPAESFPRALVEIRQTITDNSGLTREEIEDVEPLAADVRCTRQESQRHLKRMAKLRLVACILGCRFDDLRQREVERMRRLWMLGGSAVAALLLVLGSLGYSVLQHNMELGRQRRIAEERTESARLAKEDASARIRKAEQEAQDVATIASRKQDEVRRVQSQLAIADYLLKIGQASTAVESGDSATADRALAACPAERRGWEWGHLKDRLTREGWTYQPRVNRPGFYHIRFSADSSLVAIGTEPKILVLDTRKGAVVADVEIGSITSQKMWGVRYEVNFSPGNKCLILKTDKSVKVWELPTGREIAVAPAAQMRGVVVSANGDNIGWFDDTAKRLTVWNVSDRKTVLTIDGCCGDAMAFLPKGHRVAVLYVRDPDNPAEGMKAKVYSLAVPQQPPNQRRSTGRALPQQMLSSLSASFRFVYSEDGKSICAWDGNELIFFSGATGTRLSQVEFKGARSGSGGLSADHRLACYINQMDRSVEVVELQAQTRVAAFKGISFQGAALSTDSRRIALVDNAGIAVWDISRNKRLFFDSEYTERSFQPSEWKPFSNDGKWLGYVRKDGSFVLAAVTHSDEAKTITVDYSPHAGEIKYVGLDVRKQRIISADYASYIKICDFDGNQQPVCMSRGVFTMALSPNDASLAYLAMKRDRETGDGGRLMVGDGSDTRDRSIAYVPGTFFTLAFANNGAELAVGSDKKVSVYALGSSNGPARAYPCSDCVYSLAFHPSKPLLAIGLQNRLLRVWAMESGGYLPMDLGFTSGMPYGDGMDVEWSPDGKFLSLVSKKKLYVWDVTTKKLAYDLPVAGNLTSVVADRTGLRWIVGGSHGIRFVDVESGSAVMDLLPGVPVASLAFDASGRYLAAGGYDGKVHLVCSATNQLTSANGSGGTQAGQDLGGGGVWGGGSDLRK